MEDLPHTDSLTRIQKAKICSSLLHRIRVIQGQTSLNFTEPHFIESKECVVRQTKDIINSIKEGIKKGCSETQSDNLEDKKKFNSETISILVDKMKKPKKRQAKSVKTCSEKQIDKEDVRQAIKQKKNTVQDIVHFYECGEQIENLSNVKLSQIFGKTEDNRQPEKIVVKVGDAIRDGSAIKIKRKRKRKRKREDMEAESSITLNGSNEFRSLKQDEQHGKHRIKSRKNDSINAAIRFTQQSGDESDIEDDNSSLSSLSNHSRRKVRVKRSKTSRFPCSIKSKAWKERPSDITEIVSSTIKRLNTVNQSVQKVIEDSLSSGSSKALNDISPKQAGIATDKIVFKQESDRNLTDTTGSSWSTVTLSQSIITDPPEIPNDTIKIRTGKKHEPSSRPKSATFSVELLNKQGFKMDEPPKTAPAQRSRNPSGLEERIVPMLKKTEKRAVDEVIQEQETVELVKRKRNLERKQKEVAMEPVSSLKKCSEKRKKNKRRGDHVNFNNIPEYVPDYDGDANHLSSSRKLSAVSHNASSEGTNHRRLQQIQSACKKECLKTDDLPRKCSAEEKRRVNSAKIYRNLPRKREPDKVKSTGHITTSKYPEDNNRKPNNGEVQTDVNEKRARNHRGKIRSVTDAYRKVRTNTMSTIANINEQMSTTLKDSIAHLNDICKQVRTTLSDMERDEENYKKLQTRKSFEVSSEAGSMCDSKDVSLVMIEADPKAPKEKEVDNTTPTKNQVTKPQMYTVINQTNQDTSIGKLMSYVSTATDHIFASKDDNCAENLKTNEKVRKSKSHRRRTTSKAKKVVSAQADIPPKHKDEPIVETTPYNARTSTAKIPIWQKKPPSVIEEIQMTVKKQATKHQYREFLKALNTMAKKDDKSQTQVPPGQFKETANKQHQQQQEKVFDPFGRPQKLIPKKIMEMKPPVWKPSNKCAKCPVDKCTCGVSVHNISQSPSRHKMQWIRTRSDSARNNIQAYDILDEITMKDLEPIQSEYPRKDHINDNNPTKRVENTLLYKLMYHEDPQILENLLRSSYSIPKEVLQPEPAPNNNVKFRDRPKSATDAYRLYEQFELNPDKPTSINLVPNKGSLCINSSSKEANQRSRPNTPATGKPKPLQTCPKEFDDELLTIPDDLKPAIAQVTTRINIQKKKCKRKLPVIVPKPNPNEEVSLRSRKRIEDKLKILGKTSSMKSLSKRSKKLIFSRESFRVKMKNYSIDPKLRLKKILTVMPVSIVRNVEDLKEDKPIDRKIEISNASGNNEDYNNPSPNLDLIISEENKLKISKMSKREIVHILRPYIFFDLQPPPALTVMPVHTKSNQQLKHPHKQSLGEIKTIACKNIVDYIKDHDYNCHTGKKMCKKCQMSMQSGDEFGKKKFEPLSQKQLWKYKYRNTPAESLVNKILGKNPRGKKRSENPAPERKPSSSKTAITMTPRELNRTATNTRNKLKEVKNIVNNNKPLFGQNLNEIIDTLEFKIVDVLSNPKSQHTDAFNEIETEIKTIMDKINNLKELSNVNLRERFKSKTSVILEESNGYLSVKSMSDTHLIESKEQMLKSEMSISDNEDYANFMEDAAVYKTDIDKIDEETEDAEQPVMSCVEETIAEKVDVEACEDLSKGIEKVIENLDCIINIQDKEVEREETNESNESSVDFKSLSPECENAINSFCKQVDEVLKNVPNIDEFARSLDNLDGFDDAKESKSDEYLTPFMQAVKNYRKYETNQNFVDFLDKLAMFSKENVALHLCPKVAMYNTTIQHQAPPMQIAKTYDQAVQYEITTIDEVVVDEPRCETDGRNDESLEEMNAQPSVSTEKDVLSTNFWMQTVPIPEEDEEEMQEVQNEVTQTSSTEEQFNEVEVYLDSLYVTPTQTTPLVSEKDTQIPNDSQHACFVEKSSTPVQVNRDLQEMNSANTASQSERSQENSVSVESQVETGELKVKKSVQSIGIYTEVVQSEGVMMNEIPTEESIEDNMEKYTSNIMESCFAANGSEFSIDEYPRTVYTESCIRRESSKDSDLYIRGKTYSYPDTKEKSDIISLFDSRRDHDSVDTTDFIEEGFCKESMDSYDSMLARCASSCIGSIVTSSTVMQDLVPRPSVSQYVEDKIEDADEVKRPKRKEKVKEDRHKKLLTSVYGIVFTIIFFGIKLNYNC